MLTQIRTSGVEDQFKTLETLWNGCEDCPLHERRDGKVTMYRGTLPAPILLVGGVACPEDENTGHPISGREGRLLDMLIEFGSEKAGVEPPPVCITNLLGCPGIGYDLQDATAKINACRSRLARLVTLCKPRLICLLGPEAIPYFDHGTAEKVMYFNHPATILDPDHDDAEALAQRWIDNFAGAVLSLNSHRKAVAA